MTKYRQIALIVLGMMAGLGGARAQPAVQGPGGEVIPGQPPAGNVAGGAAGGAMSPEQAELMHQAAYNQLGVLEYCQTLGAIDGQAVAVQKQQIAVLPNMGPVKGVEQAEIAGRKGIVQAGPQHITLAEVAQTQSTTVEGLCTQLAGMVVQYTNPQP